MLKLEQHELDDLAILTSGGKIFSPKSDFVFKNIFSNEEVVTGFLEGVAEGIAQGKIDAVINLMKSMNLSLEKAMQVLKIDDAYKDEIKAQLKNMHGNS